MTDHKTTPPTPRRKPAKKPATPRGVLDPYAPPVALGPHGGRLWRDTLRDYMVDDAAGRALLLQAAQALDLAEKCREAIDADGLMITSPTGQRRTHPLLSAWRDARVSVATSLRGLNLRPGGEK